MSDPQEKPPGFDKPTLFVIALALVSVSVWYLFFKG